MTIFSIELAGFVFSLHTLFPDTREMCTSYITEKPFNAEITISENDIIAEAKFAAEEAAYEGLPVPRHTPGYLETTAVYRKIGDWLSHNNAAVFHGVLLEKDGEGYLFTAKSGTGKSTHAANWLKVFPDARIINGDKPILTFGDRLVGYGTPWAGKEGYQINSSVPLKAIIILSRSKENHIEPVSFKEAMPVLLGQTYRPKDAGGIQRALAAVAQMKDKVGLYSLGCNMDVSSAAVCYNGINNN